jgi:hypothetical protein
MELVLIAVAVVHAFGVIKRISQRQDLSTVSSKRPPVDISYLPLAGVEVERESGRAGAGPADTSRGDVARRIHLEKDLWERGGRRSPDHLTAAVEDRAVAGAVKETGTGFVGGLAADMGAEERIGSHRAVGHLEERVGMPTVGVVEGEWGPDL